MIVLSAADTAARLPYPALLAALRTAALEASRGLIDCPRRLVMPLPGGGSLLSMAAVAADVAVHKLVTVTPGNAQRGLPVIQAQLSVVDARSGGLRLMLDGATVTGRRTAALSMLGIATLLGRPPRRLRIYGTGTQALHHLQAIATLYPDAQLQVAGRTLPAAQSFCAAQRGSFCALEAVAAEASAAGIDVVITCTSSPEPVYQEPAQRGRLVVAIGAYMADAAEIAAATVNASELYVDDPVNARHEAGDLIRAGSDWRQVRPLAAALAGGGAPAAAAAPAGRAVLFKTVGSAAWDLAAARVALQQALAAAVTDMSCGATNVKPPYDGA